MYHQYQFVNITNIILYIINTMHSTPKNTVSMENNIFKALTTMYALYIANLILSIIIHLTLLLRTNKKKTNLIEMTSIQRVLFFMQEIVTCIMLQLNTNTIFCFCSCFFFHVQNRNIPSRSVQRHPYQATANGPVEMQ